MLRYNLNLVWRYILPIPFRMQNLYRIALCNTNLSVFLRLLKEKKQLQVLENCMSFVSTKRIFVPSLVSLATIEVKIQLET